MHKTRLSTLLFALLTALLLCACTTEKVDNRIRMAITGTWKGDQSNAEMTIYGDGRFVLEDVPGMNGQMIRGTMQRGFDQVLVAYTSPAATCHDATGLYQFDQKGDKLVFTLIREDCPVRKGQFDSSWTLVSRITDDK